MAQYTHNIPDVIKHVPKEYILCPNIKNNNKPIGIGLGWTLEKANKQIMNGDYHIQCHYFLKGTGFAVIDIDCASYTVDNLYEDTGIDCNNTLYYIGNTKGLHLWICSNRFSANFTKCGIPVKDIDYLGSNVWEKIDKEPINPDLICDVTDTQFNKLYNSACFKKREKTTSLVEYKKPSEKLNQLIELIDIQYLDNYDDWKKIVWASKNSGVDIEFMRSISKKSTKYTEAGFELIWSGDCLELTKGTINYYAKLSNEEEYYSISKEENYFIDLDIIHKGALNIATFIAPKLKQNAVYCNGIWYIYNDDTCLWNICKSPVFVLVKCIHKHLDYSLSVVTKSLNNCNNDEQRTAIRERIAEYMKQYAVLDSNKMCSQIKLHLEMILTNNEFSNKLDVNLYKVAFQNGVYDLKSNTFREGLCYDDFLSSTIPHDYCESNTEDIEFVKNVLLKICNCNTEHLNYYLSTLGHAMTGDADKEKALYYLVGLIGDNGKTLFVDVLSNIMPNYVYKIDKHTFEKGFTKAHKYLARVRGKRIVYVEELSKNKQNTELLKEYGDGKSIENEIMFGTAESINITSKLFCLSNNTPNIDADGGIQNRYRQLCFNCNFSELNKVDDYDNLKFIQDNTLSEQLIGKYKDAVFNLLLQYGHNYSKYGMYKMPDEFRLITNSTLQLNNEFQTWFNESCEIGEEFKCSKQEIESSYKKISVRELKDEVFKLGFKYDSQKKYNNSKGVFIGFRII